VPATSTVCAGAARMELSVQGRYRTSGLGVLDSEADRPKSFFLQKDKKGLAKLNRRKGCYLAADSFLDRIIRGLVPGEAGDS
jgi:hypothetical protein